MSPDNNVDSKESLGVPKLEPNGSNWFGPETHSDPIARNHADCCTSWNNSSHSREDYSVESNRPGSIERLDKDTVAEMWQLIVQENENKTELVQAEPYRQAQRHVGAAECSCLSCQRLPTYHCD
ncbi:hypothetical protein SERLA73DRAFT_146597 [Serpula lacrymans var. lacrymans S7.3]|uniref:Uncharacterized protein n=2 Tax=Serpula lacrymans var. lacrymans TaxID=341189 RepID=F8QFU7_SERL3|nr:uncharacterized protein SERLADRAFT_404267 [Serpula lacrymans var. lacrymans S7.9]EGN92837.1 hypothetical protein SERLA73DRAFT_146597 [Serpula lacrymans var. lacrymans S7.3]EGO18518.1 hypothetical protein SERLADRAFT_404267 [Serpula lacrymans var. lacrymans S7.9]